MLITRVKICGITDPADAVLAAEAGADAVGLNFIAGPRRISLDQAFAITRRLSPLVTLVALATCRPRDFPEALTPLQIGEFIPKLPICTFQMYGPTPADCFQTEYYSFRWRVVSIASRQSLSVMSAEFFKDDQDGPAAILLDTASEKLGGTGKSFNWQWIGEARDAGELDGLPPIILAGGLNPDNVAEAIRIARPYAVDVSSGVEVAGKPGVKDPIKMRDFIQAAKSA